jgi:hypothetical protein
MKDERNLAAFLSISLFSLGAYLLRGAILTSGSNSDWYMLAGAVAIALGLVTTSWSISRHLFMKRLERHARGQISSKHKS